MAERIPRSPSTSRHEFFCQHELQRRHHALAHFRRRTEQRDRAVRADGDLGIERAAVGGEHLRRGPRRKVGFVTPIRVERRKKRVVTTNTDSRSRSLSRTARPFRSHSLTSHSFQVQHTSRSSRELVLLKRKGLLPYINERANFSFALQLFVTQQNDCRL